jgi:hypothetical protein
MVKTRGSQRDVVYSALLNELKSGGGGVAGSQPISTALHNAHGVEMNFEDLL